MDLTVSGSTLAALAAQLIFVTALPVGLLIWWQKQYDGFVEEPGPDKVDESAFVTAVDPDEIAEKYKRLLDDESGKRLEAEREKRTIAIPEEEEETDE